MEFKYSVPRYQADQGVPRDWERNFSIKVTVSDNEVVLAANRAGLISLAKQLLTLAQPQVPVGSHLHYDVGIAVEDGSVPMVIILTDS